jgi:hypothetical protein
LADLNPAQQRVADGLLDLGGTRPPLDTDLGQRLAASLGERTRWAVNALDEAGETLFVNKHAVATVLACETRWRVGSDFAWSRATATGSIAHQAAELLLMGKLGGAPADAVDGIVADLRGSDDSLGQFLDFASPTDLAAIRSAAITNATTVVDGFPPIGRGWNARAEQSYAANLGGRTIVLNARPDLAFGRPTGPDARSLLIDFKTGRPHQTHIDDLRYYALVFTLRWGVPPWRIATYYAVDGTWMAEDVDADVLDAAAHRLSDAILRMAEIVATNRPLGLTPHHGCNWCGLKDTCEGAAEWARLSVAETDLATYDDEDEAPF